jgi:hypothetical protein
MSGPQDKPLPGFFQSLVEIAVARTRAEMQAAVEEVERRVEVEVERRVKDIEAKFEQRDKEREAELQKQLAASPNTTQPRSRGSVTRAANRAVAAVLNDLLGTHNFPKSETELAKAIVEKAQALEGIELHPDSRSVRDIAADTLAGIKLAEKAEREAR